MGVDMDFVLKPVETYFLALKDPRSSVNQKHPFLSVNMIAVLAVIAGADSPTAISRRALLKSECLRENTVSTRYYISSLPVSVKRFAHAVRQHWAIENTCHWTQGHTFREDESRIANVQSREKFVSLNRFGLSLLKPHPAKIRAVMKRRSWARNDAFPLETVLGAKE